MIKQLHNPKADSNPNPNTNPNPYPSRVVRLAVCIRGALNMPLQCSAEAEVLADGAERVPKFGRTSAEYFSAMTRRRVDYAPVYGVHAYIFVIKIECI